MIKFYLDLIAEAARAVQPGYFKLATAYAPDGIVRERVFCYEFYHQIRSRMDGQHPLLLHGEIDKRGHPDFEAEDQKNPDFVFHVPGTHEHNAIVVEVKGSLSHPADIVQDTETLLKFVNQYHYELGIFLLYNHSFDELAALLRSNLDNLGHRPGAENVVILCIERAHGTVERITLAECNRKNVVKATEEERPAHAVR